jgi:hypothetical protein
MKLLGGILQAASVVFLWIDFISVGFGNGVYLWAMMILTIFPVVSLANTFVSSTLTKGKRPKRPVTGIHFPLMWSDDGHHLL